MPTMIPTPSPSGTDPESRKTAAEEGAGPLSGQVPEASPGAGPGSPVPLSHQAHRQLIGYLGIFLPIILLGLAGLRPTPGLPRWQPLESVSSYYYTGATAAFVGMLVGLALFLFTYGGYEGYAADRIVAKVGAVCALGVAFFPTAAPLSLTEPVWWKEITRTIHYLSATCLFLVFIVFSLWLFRKSGEGPVSVGKRQRNLVYLVCGLVMVASVLWAGSSYFTGAPIFWAETFALWAFAVSWLVKGYAHRPVVDTMKEVLGVDGEPDGQGPS